MIIMTAKKIMVEGIVQGVGFRPFIYRLAQEYKLKGFINNNSKGVYIEVEGEEANIGNFIQAIQQNAPLLAYIDNISIEPMECKGYVDFFIEESAGDEERFTLISPDVSVCEDCLRELFDPNNRRYKYPFINCTDCGPRFTIIQDIPYDRPKTTMAIFPMCNECTQEYHDPSNRRFHAQPNACSECGPHISLLDAQRNEITTDNPIGYTVQLLKNGSIIAIKGLGGYHLACDALNDRAVSELRLRKLRIEKPFAIMIPDLGWLCKICDATLEEKEFLISIQRPIVLIKRKKDSPISKEVAPYNNYLGVMLPYTPLHHLILKEAGIPLVMTSGNISEEPIAYKDNDAFERLKNIADYFLVHNREIFIQCDDSVGAVIGGRMTMLRRSRGYVPYPTKINIKASQPVLAVGGHLKNTFCFIKNNYAFLSHHIGDLENYETLRSLMEGVEHFKNLFTITPEIIAYDMHPEYLSTKYALQSDIPVKIPVQHHHAHIVSCMTENNLNDPVIGVSFDGTGYGTDGNIWGGEFLIADTSTFKRTAHFEYFPLPGGEMAIKQPWRTAVSILYQLYGDNFKELDLSFVGDIKKDFGGTLTVVEQMIRNKLNSPLTSAAGRVFDAVAALCRVCYTVNYEAQAAIEFQMIADESVTSLYRFDIDTSTTPWQLSYHTLMREIISDLQKSTPVEIISAKFHNTIAKIIKTVTENIYKDTGIKKVCLSGGVFQNVLLVNKTVDLLKRSGFKVYTHSIVPPNDGGLSLGQAVIALNRKVDN